MWLCPNCGKEVEEQFDTCSSCGTGRAAAPDPSSRTGSDMPAGGGTAADADLSPNEAIAEILRLQREQAISLSATRTQVGCLYAWMIFGIVVGVICFFWILLAWPQRQPRIEINPGRLAFGSSPPSHPAEQGARPVAAPGTPRTRVAAGATTRLRPARRGAGSP